ncbi:hypothetical protein GOBAR_DD33092 [Gossypium barbadense]|nr:hypothetical protein GOBAR_DD33092 [Gossypium barbadense]
MTCGSDGCDVRRLRRGGAQGDAALGPKLLGSFSFHCEIVSNRWTPPCEDAAKVNVGMAQNAETECFACGAIVHDHEGMVLIGFACLIAEAFVALSVEVLALVCAF